MGGGNRPPTAGTTFYRPVGGFHPQRRVVGVGFGGRWWVVGVGCGGRWWVWGVVVFIQRELTRLLSVQELSVVLAIVCVRLLLLFVFYAVPP